MNFSRIHRLAAIAAMLLPAAGVASAQSGTDNGKKKLPKLFAEAVSAATESTVRVQSGTKDIALGTEGKAIVQEVAEDSPAAKAGFEEGDLIVKWNGEKVKKPDDIAAMLTGFEPGQVVPVEIKREDAVMTLKITLAKKPNKK